MGNTVIILLVITQTLAAILLGAINLLPCLKGQSGGLNRKGFMLLGLGATIFLSATATVQILNRADAERKQKRIEDLLNKYFALAAARDVMATSKGPNMPILHPKDEVLKITYPQDQGEVDPKNLIKGTASDLAGDVWVVVHPMDTSSYWVQPRVSKGSGGVWSVIAYFGRSGVIDKGKSFQVVAISDTQDPVGEGEYSTTWPRAKFASKAITLIRR